MYYQVTKHRSHSSRVLSVQIRLAKIFAIILAFFLAQACAIRWNRVTYDTPSRCNAQELSRYLKNGLFNEGILNLKECAFSLEPLSETKSPIVLRIYWQPEGWGVFKFISITYSGKEVIIEERKATYNYNIEISRIQKKIESKDTPIFRKISIKKGETRRPPPIDLINKYNIMTFPSSRSLTNRLIGLHANLYDVHLKVNDRSHYFFFYHLRIGGSKFDNQLISFFRELENRYAVTIFEE